MSCEKPILNDNRTYVELKLPLYRLLCSLHLYDNRTYVELKLVINTLN